jgi:hypothetical protein
MMKKVLFLASFVLFALLHDASAQTTQPAQGQPVSSSRDITVTASAEVSSTDSTGTASSSAKDATGPANAATAELPASPGAGKADDKKQPKR